MKLIITNDHKEMSEKAYQLVKQQITNKLNSVLGLPTGATPEEMYELLIRSNKDKEITFKDISTFNLDEYVGINKDHATSYFSYMNNKFFNHIDINKENTYIPSGQGNVKANATKYDELITKHDGVDLQILGIGENGHIGFNEPGSSETSGTIIVQLTQSTIDANSRYFDNKNNVPTTAITMGIKTILKAKKIILMASGKKKAEAIRKLVDGPITTNVPASFLQNHDNVVVIIDKDAASLLMR
ncbi:glucosamine-6-phosphate deaminase [Candidatus Mycoplasma mahonii]|uniref:glucosamine-6-phosphate deaminase n=1 Tax=Candidatus Mycoplasma mahonii TaxID=3004105 RepID=UPI0026EE7FFC|nr:glucosamine-6-phosphate deaminase [Candidatus Mycoplasma mahonii]WKX02556.1 glucosamine-6-phosphate deaminase [Candidatus Mycoplasma mahonii]